MTKYYEIYLRDENSIFIHEVTGYSVLEIDHVKDDLVKRGYHFSRFASKNNLSPDPDNWDRETLASLIWREDRRVDMMNFLKNSDNCRKILNWIRANQIDKILGNG